MVTTGRARIRSFGHAEVFAAIFLSSFLAARFLPVLAVPYVCPAKALFGLPCPACGMTHAFVYLAHADVLAALNANPAGALLAFLVWGFVVFDLVRLFLGKGLPKVPGRAARLFIFLGGMLVLSSWGFLLAKGGV